MTLNALQGTWTAFWRGCSNLKRIYLLSLFLGSIESPDRMLLVCPFTCRASRNAFVPMNVRSYLCYPDTLNGWCLSRLIPNSRGESHHNGIAEDSGSYFDRLWPNKLQRRTFPVEDRKIPSPHLRFAFISGLEEGYGLYRWDARKEHRLGPVLRPGCFSRGRPHRNSY